MENKKKNNPKTKRTSSFMDKEHFYYYEEIYHPGCCIHQGAEPWGWRVSLFWGVIVFKWVRPDDRAHCGAAFHNHPWHGMNTRL